tara:strand:+ start:6927 stop:7646 length:720 start_codon:yes stop_codon:yes gene_type:complete
MNIHTDLIMVPSIPHMGTNTAAAAVQSVTGGDVVTHKDLFSRDGQWTMAHPFPKMPIYKVHMGIDPKHGSGLEAGHRYNSLPTEVIIALVEKYKTVIPIRDPIMAVITRIERAKAHGDNLSYDYSHMFEMLNLIILFHENQDAFIYPMRGNTELPQHLSCYLLGHNYINFSSILPQNTTTRWKWITNGLDNINKELREKYINGQSIDNTPLEPLFGHLYNNEPLKNFYKNFGFQLRWMK